MGGPGSVRYLRREGVIAKWEADAGLIRAAERVADAMWGRAALGCPWAAPEMTKPFSRAPSYERPDHARSADSRPSAYLHATIIDKC